MSDYLCEQLMVEIFTRLPPKSLIRFRSLCKSLCTCISSPGFICMHKFRSPQKILFTHKNNVGKSKEVELLYTLHGEDEITFCLCPKRGHIGIKTTFPFPSGIKFRVVGSCNGVFCFRTRKELILWNPSIRRKLSVPQCPWRTKRDPLKEGNGFGFDPISDDYKIVWISYATDSSFVYAVKTGTWCEISSPKPRFTSMSLFLSLLLNGVFHWEVYYKDDKSQDIYRHSYLLTFNLSTHVFGIIPLPALTWNWMTTGLTSIQGSLAIISYGMYLDDSWIRVWRNTSWSVVYKLNTEENTVTSALQLQVQPTNSGDLLLSIDGEGLQVYNFKTGVRSRVLDFNDASTVVDFCEYVETLHLLDMGETACGTTLL